MKPILNYYGPRGYWVISDSPEDKSWSRKLLIHGDSTKGWEYEGLYQTNVLDPGTKVDPYPDLVKLWEENILPFFNPIGTFTYR